MVPWLGREIGIFVVDVVVYAYYYFHIAIVVKVDKAFIGISGIDIKKGITAADQIEAQTKKNIINCAKTVIALADHSKIGHVSMNFIAPVDAVDVFITDSETNGNFIDTLKSMDIEVVIK